MEFKIRCATWIREEDEKVLQILQKSEKMLSAEELAELTGLPLFKVEHTLQMLKRQMNYVNKEKELQPLD